MSIISKSGTRYKKSRSRFLMPPHPLANAEIQKHYQNEPKRNRVFSQNNLSKLKDRTCVIKHDEFKPVETHWIALYLSGNNVTFFDSFGAAYIPREIKRFIGNKNIATNIYRMQANDSIMCGYFCIGFIDFMLKGKSLLDYTNLSSPNEYEKMKKQY